ncbi:MAG: TetR/AcrR family transcriptional regulator [Planctomycetota bacterium]
MVNIEAMEPVLTRKQREIRAREQLILNIARSMLVERGYLGLTMDRIAKATEYSKGTIYQHFSCKEEILAALAVESGRKRSQLFERAARFKGRPRERMSAIGEANNLFACLHPHHFQSELVITTHSFREKTPRELQAQLEGCEQRCLAIAMGVVRDAIAQGDLDLPEEGGVETLTFGLWSMCFGAHVIATADIPVERLMASEPMAMLRINAQRFMDGYGWRPLMKDWDYLASLDRIRQ